jgi:nucleotide-binding universal stress UspA family protein
MITHAHPETIAVGIDGSLAARAAVRWAINHARPGDTVDLIHAWEPSPTLVATGLARQDDDAPARRLVQHELAHIAALPHDEQVTVTGHVVHGDPRDLLCQTDADVVVVGSDGRGALARALLGSVCAHLAHHGHVPVVIVPFHEPTTAP